MTDRIVDEVGGSPVRSRRVHDRGGEGAALPVPLTTFIGRQHDVAGVSDLILRHDVRLVTLAGPAGVGKTRLAIQVASEVSDRFADGVRFVALGSVMDVDLVVPTIARDLGVWETSSEAVTDLLIGALRSKELLLVLDNLEQVIGAGPSALSEVLSGCPRLRMLVTSRALLRISGEHAYPVPPMAVPDLGRLPSTAELERIESVRLFVQRASAARAGFALDEGNAESIAAVCRRLEGLPLAIELAAARVAHLPPRGILARLSPALPLLTGGPADAPLRLRTMRDAVAWSYELLAPEEQRVVQRLSVFVGGCTLDAAAAVALFDRLDGGDMLVLMSSLVDQSLVSLAEGPDGEPRFTMLEAIREFGLEQLALSGDEVTTRRAHADHYLGLAETSAPHLVGAQQREWLDRLEVELANIRIAITWRDGPDDERALRMSAALAMLWYVRNHLREGSELVQRALSRVERAAHDRACRRAPRCRPDGVRARGLSSRSDAHAPEHVHRGTA